MGQRSSRNSSPLHRNLSFHSSFRTKKKSQKGDLSATFNILEVNTSHPILLNINNAAEEELMTLPGISRTIARNIVDYRHAIGGFKRVEDVALVSGIGANKLEQIRNEITTSNRCYVPRKNECSSCQSSISEDQSVDSFFSGESGRCNRPFFKVVNVNSANVFQLMSVQGITQELAANIVYYRDRKGSFKNLDQLLRVKGFNYRILGMIRLYLTTESPKDVENDSGVLDMKPNGENVSCYNYANNSNKLKCHRRCKSAPTKYTITKDDCSDNDLFILLSNRSKRPILEPIFDFEYEKRSAVRVASWFLDDFTTEKANNHGVQEVICRTLLENGFGVVVFQDLLRTEVLESIVSQLNKPTFPWVKQWPGGCGIWKLASFMNKDEKMSYCSIMYDASQDLELIDCHVSSITNDLNTILKIKDISLKIFGSSKLMEFSCKENLDSISQNNSTLDDHVTVISSMDVSNCDIEKINLVPLCCDLNSIDIASNHPHILTRKSSEQHFTGRRGIVTEGLTHLAIPNGWKWGGTVSHQPPSWIEIFVQ